MFKVKKFSSSTEFKNFDLDYIEFIVQKKNLISFTKDSIK